jgi:DNA invertase Pin-like site-specific DNA recombinase
VFIVYLVFMSKGAEPMNTATATAATFAAYVRVSTDGQAESGLGMEAQRDAIARWAAYRGVELAWYIDAGVSAGKRLEKRPEGRRLAEDLAAGRVAGVVAAKLDRLFRDALETLECTRAWDRAGVSVVLLDLGVDTATPMGRAFLTMAAAFAELERARIAERTRDGLAVARTQGRRHGRLALGETLGETVAQARPNGRLDVLEVAAEARTVRRILDLRAEGMSLRAIVAELVADGAETKTGGRWHATTVSRVLARAGVA